MCCDRPRLLCRQSLLELEETAALDANVDEARLLLGATAANLLVALVVEQVESAAGG